MKLKCIGCDALARVIYFCAAKSPHIVDVTLMQLGLHREPEDLRARLQHEIDVAEGYDAVVMAYGLCGKATAGLAAGAVPVVIPRAHDCITLFLGDRQRYEIAFKSCPGTYWYAMDYVERNESLGTALALGSEGSDDISADYDKYVEKYGKENADYLMEVMGAWKNHYERAVFIDMGVSDSTVVEQQTKEQAERRGWRFERLVGDLVLVRKLLAGDWDEDFLILQPGQKIQMTYNHEVIAGA